jgi:hypothetical protein
MPGRTPDLDEPLRPHRRAGMKRPDQMIIANFLTVG